MKKVRQSALAILCICFLPSSASWHRAQTRRPPRVVTSLTDVVSAICFSPNGRVLALTRKVHDVGRVELWDTQTGNLLHAIKGFDGAVWSVSFAADGRTLVTASGGLHSNKIQEKSRARDGIRFAELKWWDTRTGDLKQRVELPGEDWMSVVALHTPNGELLATLAYHLPTFAGAFANNTTADRLGPLTGLPVGGSIAYEADLNLLDARTGEVRLKLKPGLRSYQMFSGRYDPEASFSSALFYDSRRQPLAFSADGRFVAASNAKEIKIWNCQTGKEAYKIKLAKGRASALVFSPDGRALAVAVTKFQVRNDQQIIQSEINLHDATDGTLRQTLAVNTETISSIAFARNGQQILISGLQREQRRSFATLELVDIHKGSEGSLTAKDEGTVSLVAVSPRGDRVAFQTDATTVNLVDTQTWKITHTFSETDASAANASLGRFMLSVKSVMALAFSPDGRMVSGEIEQGGIKQWDARTGEVKKHFAEDGDTGPIAGMAANGSTTVTADDDGTLHLWDTASGHEKTFTENAGPVSALALSSDGQTLAVGYADRLVIMNTVGPKLIRTFERAGVSCLAFSADGYRLATGGADGLLDIWDLDGAPAPRKMQFPGKVAAVGFSPDGAILVSGGADGSVSFWDSRTGALNRQLKKHKGPVNAIAFSPKGDLMATGSDDRTVIVWETASGKSQRTLKGHDLAVTSVAFSPDASLLACGTGNTSVVLWEVRSGNLSRVLK